MAAIDAGVLAVFGIVALAFVLFATERVPVDVTALLVMVLLMVFEPWTRITPREGISGFANPAMVTVLAMLTLSVGVSKTGAVQKLGALMADFADGDLRSSSRRSSPPPGLCGQNPSARPNETLTGFRGNCQSWGRGVAWYPCGLGCR